MIFDCLPKSIYETCFYSFDSEEIIHHEGEKCDELGIVLKGEVRIISYSLQGHEEMYACLHKGEVYGNNLMFSVNPYYLGDVHAGKNTELLIIKKDLVLKLLQENVTFLEEFLELNALETLRTKKLNRVLAKRSIEERIICFLQEEGGSVNLTIQELSSRLSLQRPSVSRVIVKMVDDGTIIKNKREITLKDF